jgi:hypothetical protein
MNVKGIQTKNQFDEILSLGFNKTFENEHLLRKK